MILSNSHLLATNQRSKGVHQTEGIICPIWRLQCEAYMLVFVTFFDGKPPKTKQ